MTFHDSDVRPDPAAAVAGLLTRLAIFALVVLVPMLGMVSRRAVLVFIPLAAALLVIAAFLQGRLLAILPPLLVGLVRPPALAAVALFGFALVSLAWAPPGAIGAARLGQIAAVGGLFAVVIASLPTRTRWPDVNLVPIGLSVAAVVLSLTMLLGRPGGESTPETLRAAVLLVLLFGPAAAALLAKDRRWQTAVLVAIIGATLWLVRDAMVIVAFLFVLLTVAFVHQRPRGTALTVGLALAVAVFVAPAIGWLMVNHGGQLLPGEGDALMRVWRDVTYALPTHPLLGFGFEASGVLKRVESGVLLDNPRSAALQLWLELGFVGAALAILTLVLAARQLAEASVPLQASLTPVLMAAGVFMFAGLSSWQVWWVIALGLALMISVFVARAERRKVRR